LSLIVNPVLRLFAGREEQGRGENYGNDASVLWPFRGLLCPLKEVFASLSAISFVGEVGEVGLFPLLRAKFYMLKNRTILPFSS
jgi:hypothetical protein